MSMTKRERAQLLAIMSDLERGIAYIDKEDVSLAQRTRTATTTLHFTRKPLPDCLIEKDTYNGGAYSLYEVNKDIGSEFCLARNALRRLKTMLFPIVENAP